MSSLPANIKRIGSKTTEKRWRHRFLHYKSMGAFCCHGNHSFDPICPKTLCSLSPTPVMLHIKFDQDWPTGFRDIQVWKRGRRRRRTTTGADGWQRKDDGPLVYYKLTLWAFSSGELIRNKMLLVFFWSTTFSSQNKTLGQSNNTYHIQNRNASNMSYYLTGNTFLSWSSFLKKNQYNCERHALSQNIWKSEIKYYTWHYIL